MFLYCCGNTVVVRQLTIRIRCLSLRAAAPPSLVTARLRLFYYLVARSLLPVVLYFCSYALPFAPPFPPRNGPCRQPSFYATRWLPTYDVAKLRTTIQALYTVTIHTFIDTVLLYWAVLVTTYDIYIPGPTL